MLPISAAHADAVLRGGDGAGAVVLARVADGLVDELAGAFADDDDEVGVLGGEEGLEAAPVLEGGLDVLLGDLIGLGVVDGEACVGVDEDCDGAGVADVVGEGGFGLGSGEVGGGEQDGEGDGSGDAGVHGLAF